MPHSFNFQKYVKIFLADAPDNALSEAHKSELIDIKKKSHQVSLVIDKRLHNDETFNIIHQFCEKNEIELFDVNALRHQATETENQLFFLYDFEIKAIETGGCTKRATQYLKWISAILKKGIYSDFGMFDTIKQLPATGQGEAPILFPLTAQLNSEVCIDLSILAIPEDKNPIIDTLIKKIQESILLNSFSGFEPSLFKVLLTIHQSLEKECQALKGTEIETEAEQIKENFQLHFQPLLNKLSNQNIYLRDFLFTGSALHSSELKFVEAFNLSQFLTEPKSLTSAKPLNPSRLSLFSQTATDKDGDVRLEFNTCPQA